MDHSISIKAGMREVVGTRESNVPVYVIQVTIESVVCTAHLDRFLKEIDDITKSYHVTASLV